MTDLEKKLNHAGTVFVGYIGLIGILVATAGVFTRFVLKISISWSDELLRTIFVWGYFIGAVWCYQEGGIMRLELAEDALKKRGRTAARKILRLVCEVVDLLFFGVSAYFVYDICLQHIARGTTSGTSSTPAWILPASYGVGCLLITLFAAKNIVSLLRGGMNEVPAASEVDGGAE